MVHMCIIWDGGGGRRPRATRAYQITAALKQLGVVRSVGLRCLGEVLRGDEVGCVGNNRIVIDSVLPGRDE